jgi:hypothetical protein
MKARISLVSLTGLLSCTSLLLGCEEFGLPGSAPDVVDEGSEESSDRDRESVQPSAEPGSCNDWKISYCEAVEECSAFSTTEECQIDLGFVRCASNAPFKDCQERIDAAIAGGVCSDLPTDCNPEQIADRTLPAQACQDIYGAICELGFFCGSELSFESCLASLLTSTPCDQFTAVLPESEQCIDALSVQACGDPLPPICNGVLRY